MRNDGVPRRGLLELPGSLKQMDMAPEVSCGWIPWARRNQNHRLAICSSLEHIYMSTTSSKHRSRNPKIPEFPGKLEERWVKSPLLQVDSWLTLGLALCSVNLGQLRILFQHPPNWVLPKMLWSWPHLHIFYWISLVNITRPFSCLHLLYDKGLTLGVKAYPSNPT